MKEKMKESDSGSWSGNVKENEIESVNEKEKERRSENGKESETGSEKGRTGSSSMFTVHKLAEMPKHVFFCYRSRSRSGDRYRYAENPQVMYNFSPQANVVVMYRFHLVKSST